MVPDAMFFPVRLASLVRGLSDFRSHTWCIWAVAMDCVHAIARGSTCGTHKITLQRPGEQLSRNLWSRPPEVSELLR